MEIKNLQEPTSLKQLIQGMAPEAPGVVQGTVTAADPLVITLVGDDKMVLPAGVLIVPRHLTDYTIKVDISLDEGSIDSQTREGEGKHPHGPSGGHAQEGGDGEHSHPADEGEHIHHLETYTILGATMKVYNALKEGETVYLLAFNQGKKYYVLDREEEDES